MKAVFLDFATVDCNDLDTRVLYEATPEWTLYPTSLPEEASARIGDAEVVVVNKCPLDRHTIESAPRLRLICVAATGTNHIDLAAAARRQIPVCNARDYATHSVVQHVFTLMLLLATRVDAYREDIRAGRWSEQGSFCLLHHPITALADLHLGIVGYGVLGKATAALARNLGMRVSVAGSLQEGAVPDPSRPPLEELLPELDIVSLHCPLTPTTYRWFHAERFARMRRGSWIINTARGGIIDSQDLADALRSGHLGGAGLDVLDIEPPPKDHPLLAHDIPNLVLTPHTAWAARSARQNVLNEVSANILAFRSGHPRHTVHP